jgi:anti-sigma B factor antagonist
MKFQESSINEVLVVKVLESRITADVALGFKEGLVDYVKKGNKIIILDLSEVSFIDSSGLGALVGSLKTMGKDGELLLAGARETVTSMFKLTRMDKIFRMFGSPEQAAEVVSKS